MLKIAFATNNRERVNQHFGTAESFAIYEVNERGSALVAISEFPEEHRDGHEDKLQAKVDFLEECAAVFVMAIGASAIKLLITRGIQPVRIAENSPIEPLLTEISTAMRMGGIPWVERAVAKTRLNKDSARFTRMEDEGWQG